MTYAHYRISRGSGPRRMVALGVGVLVPALSIIALDQGLNLHLGDKIVDIGLVAVRPTPPPPTRPDIPPPNPGTDDVSNVDVPQPKFEVDTSSAGPSITARPGVDSQAKFLASNDYPLYPDAAKRGCEQGTVTLNLQIGADGRVTDASVANSSGYPALDDAALRAARGWRFAPARQGGSAVASSLTQNVKFDLRNEIGVSMTAAEVRECLRG